MYFKRYLINKYLAFAFMVFAVLSGVSDGYSEINTAAGGSGLPYFLKINQLLTQKISKIKNNIVIDKYKVFHSYIESITTDSGSADAAKLCLGVGVLLFASFFASNKLTQNNIWRNAVF